MQPAQRQRNVRQQRVPLLALGMMCLGMALWAGLARLGWSVPLPRSGWMLAHGPLMICGFLGTLIGLERGAALQRGWALVGPALSGTGALVLVAFPDPIVGSSLIALGSVGLVAACAELLRRQPTAFNAVIALGGMSWLVGNTLWWMGWPPYGATPWWMGFLVLTIAGERLELSRLLPRARWKHAGFFAALALLLGGMVLSLTWAEAGARMFGAGLLALGLWLGWFDIARRTVRKPGLGRFVAVSLLLGYGWLGLGGALLWWGGAPSAGSVHDAWVHGVLLGFVFSMIFGHAPIIFPALLRARMVFQTRFYAHLGLLHVSLALRVGGDLLGVTEWMQWGGLLNAGAIALFLFNTARAMRLHTRN